MHWGEKFGCNGESIYSGGCRAYGKLKKRRHYRTRAVCRRFHVSDVAIGGKPRDLDGWIAETRELGGSRGEEKLRVRLVMGVWVL